MLKSQAIKKILFVLLIVITFLTFVFTYSIGLSNDEFFTVGLIKHSYSSLIGIDALDVHPPLYYIIVKLFLQITTFWTNSIIIKIIFSRLLSLIFFVITFLILLKILKLFKLYINVIILLIMYSSYSCILLYSITIRMYQMDVLLLVLEIYGLLLIKYNNIHLKYLLLILFSIIFSLYTNYFSAAFACSILLVNIILSIICKNKNVIYLILVGAIDLILYLPCLSFMFTQATYVSHSSYSNFVGASQIGRNMYIQLLGAFTGRNITDLKSIIISIIFAIIELFIVFHASKFVNFRLKDLLIELYLSYIIGLFPFIVLSYITHPMIEARYGIPIFNIIFFFLTIITIKWLSIYKYTNYLSILFLLIFLVLNLKSCFSIYHNDIRSINTVRKVYIFKKSKSHVIVLDTRNSTEILRPLYYSVYLPNNSHKVIIAKHMAIKNILASDNTKLIHKTFTNIKLRDKSNKTYY